MSGEDREQGGNGNRDAERDEDQERNGDAEQSEDVPLSDLRRDIERRRGRESERTDEESATGPGQGRDRKPGVGRGREADRGRGREADRGRDREADKERGRRVDQERGEEPDQESGEEASAKGPLSNLREGVERRRRERQESPPDADEAFEKAASEPMIDGEQVWEDLLASQEEATAGLAFGEEVEGEAEDVRIIPDRICHNCTYFGDPPELHCEHEGTEIRRVVDHDHFEVVECPVVKHRSDLAGQ